MDATYTAGDSLVANEIDGETVVLNLSTGRYFGLNAVAAAIWAWVQEPRTLDDLVELVTTDFDVEGDIARVDTMALLSEMAERGLVTTDGA